MAKARSIDRGDVRDCNIRPVRAMLQPVALVEMVDCLLRICRSHYSVAEGDTEIGLSWLICFERAVRAAAVFLLDHVRIDRAGELGDGFEYRAGRSLPRNPGGREGGE